jgi:hypothetical protein
MTRAIRNILITVFPLFVMASCATGGRLYIPGDLSRPAGAQKATSGAPRAAVADFSYAAVEPEVVGRDFDQVRPIVWRGEPGKAMADLVFRVLAEKGIPAVRVASDADAPADVPFRIGGTVRRFEVNARRAGGVSVVSEATVSLSVTAAGGAVPPMWEATVTSSSSAKDVFVTPEGARDVLLTSANAAAEEAARRLLDAGVAAPALPGK